MNYTCNINYIQNNWHMFYHNIVGTSRFIQYCTNNINIQNRIVLVVKNANIIEFFTYHFPFNITEGNIHYIILKGIEIKGPCHSINIYWCYPSPVYLLKTFPKRETPPICLWCLLKARTRIGTIVELTALVVHSWGRGHKLCSHLKRKNSYVLLLPKYTTI